ncbi:Ubiquitin carboxyl-terminal hydrolase 14 [Giardia lamblia P15]|uniref:ubiquitinyl hydrolase 1 n=1 Tax=Giardia intestinalis (strain P15) TaxID=658858 RepID=E1EZB5_GIAIA|nr:Ubiquitin carboxyl-terminal hydrolase 14 [Giardia lamblia P15]
MSKDSVPITLQVFFNGSPYTVTVNANDNVSAICAAISPLVGVNPNALCIFSETWVGALQHDVPLTYFRVQKDTKIYCFGSNEVAAVTRAEVNGTIDGLDGDGMFKEEILASGVENVGNTCFFGAALQCLFRCTVLRTALLYMLPARALEHCDLFVRALSSAFQTLDKRQTTVNPKELLTLFGALHTSLIKPQLNGYAMQDAQETLSQILNDLSLALPVSSLGVMNNAGYLAKDYLELRSAMLSSLEDGSSENSVVDCLFNMKVEYHTDEIGQKPVSTDSKYFLSINLTEKCYSLLDQLDKEMGEEEIIINGEQHKRISRFNFLPPYLFVVINRFLWEEQAQRRLKINRRFTFPFTIDLYRYCSAGLQTSLDSLASEREDASASTIGSANYFLVSVIAHHGLSAESGHYITFSRIKDNLWVKLNDASVTEVTTEDIEALAGGSPTFVAYVLLYEYTAIGL